MFDQSPTATVPMDLEPHLPLVTHVVRQLASRVPSHVSREAMWVHGAIGLAVAARQHADDGAAGPFGTRALRAVRAEVVAGVRRDAPLPSNADLARQLGTSEAIVARHRATLVPTAPGPTDGPAAPAPDTAFASRTVGARGLGRTAQWIPAPA